MSEDFQVAGAGFARAVRIVEENLESLVRLDPAGLELVDAGVEEGIAALVLKIDAL